MRRFLITIIAITLGIFFASKDLKIEEDPVKSLKSSDLELDKVFDFYHQNSVFKNKIFVDYQRLSPNEIADVENQILVAGYKKKNFKNISDEFYKLLPLLPVETLKQTFSHANIQTIAKNIQVLSISVPGGGALLEQFIKDPFFLKKTLLDTIVPVFKQTKGHPQTYRDPSPSGQDDGLNIRVYDGPSQTNYQVIGELYDLLKSLELSFIGGDFFSYENYRAIKSDITMCMAISIPLNLMLFFIFTRSFILVLFLLLGSLISYACGLMTVRLFYDQVYALVFAFTSTFIGFNNEYLVHFSSLDKNQWGKHFLSLGSAIGTTFIGFVILLFAQSEIIKQMALVSLGGMIGFIAFMLMFQDQLSTVKIKEFSWRQRRIPKFILVLAWVLPILYLSISPLPEIRTDINHYKYSSRFLADQLKHFSDKSTAINLVNQFAVKVTDDLFGTYQTLLRKYKKSGFHPLDRYLPPEFQQDNITYLTEHYSVNIEKLQSELNKRQLFVKLRSDLTSNLLNILPEDYLTILSNEFDYPFIYSESLSPNKYIKYIFYPLDENSLGASKQDPIPMNPKFYYDSLLTGLSKQMAVLFLIGLLIMAFYLLPLQRRLYKILYIFAPLLLFFLTLVIYFNSNGIRLNLIHFLAFALLIALILDYTSIAVSTNFSRKELNKIVFTALSALISFGVLAIAQHPVLRILGTTVVSGTALALLFVMFFRTA